MGIFRRRVPTNLIRIHPDNATNKDWLILLEAGTIVGPSPDKLRVGRSTLERKVVKKYNILLRAEHFLVVDGYDPRIHAVYFCPQLYRYDPDKKLVPLQGEEIGSLIAHALEAGIAERCLQGGARQFPLQRRAKRGDCEEAASGKTLSRSKYKP